jgi:hypothetical protein
MTYSSDLSNLLSGSALISTDALAHQDHIDRIGELSDWLQQEYGAVTDEELAQARRIREGAQSRIAAQGAAAETPVDP